MVKFAHARPRACVYKIFFVPLRRKSKIETTIFCLTNNYKFMKTDKYTKQSPINEADGGSVSVHHLLTADEFIAQMEPRIRAMFK